MAKKSSIYTTAKMVEQYQLLSPLLSTIAVEMKELSKKKADTPINTYKLKVINRVLEPIRKMMSNESSIQYLDLLVDDDLPSNSDVVLIISQYIAALTMFREKYYSYDNYEGEYTWKTK